MTYTKAPWRIEWEMAHGGSSHRVCDSTDMGGLSVVATVHFHDDAEGETKASARLIDAAPELLDLLCEALPFVEDAEDDPGFKPGFVKKKVARIRALIERIEEPK